MVSKEQIEAEISKMENVPEEQRLLMAVNGLRCSVTRVNLIMGGISMSAMERADASV